jgi:hypothetical protein
MTALCGKGFSSVSTRSGSTGLRGPKRLGLSVVFWQSAHAHCWTWPRLFMVPTSAHITRVTAVVEERVLDIGQQRRGCSRLRRGDSSPLRLLRLCGVQHGRVRDVSAEVGLDVSTGLAKLFYSAHCGPGQTTAGQQSDSLVLDTEKTRPRTSYPQSHSSLHSSRHDCHLYLPHDFTEWIPQDTHHLHRASSSTLSAPLV